MEGVEGVEGGGRGVKGWGVNWFRGEGEKGTERVSMGRGAPPGGRTIEWDKAGNASKAGSVPRSTSTLSQI